MTDYAKLKELAEAATQGEWQVIETELPCRIGRAHVERRIFTTKDHPQLKAPYPVVNGSVALGTDEIPVHHMVSLTAEDASFIAAANPAAVLGLIADNDQLHGECNNHMETISALKAECEGLRNALGFARHWCKSALSAAQVNDLEGSPSSTLLDIACLLRHQATDIDAAMAQGGQSNG